MKNIYILSFLILQFTFCQSQHFQNVTNIQNLDIISEITDFNGGWGNGVSFYDFDKDGWDDLTIALENDTIAFYKNNFGSFERIPSFIPTDGRVKQVLWVDYDNDGHLDLFITQYGAPYKLFKNDGLYNFIDVSIQSGLPQVNLNTWGAAFGDYNKDGFLDLYIAMYETGAQSPENPLRTNQLFMNNGDGTFTNVTIQAGVSNGLQLSFLGAWIDYNRDGWSDLYVINDRTPFNNSLYRNNGDGTFTDVATDIGADMVGEDPMTISVADFDNDGDYDIFMTNSGGSTKPSKLLVNNANQTFTESSVEYGVNFFLNSWGALWLDYNNNSYRDLFVSIDEQFFQQPQMQNLFFINNNGQNFILSDTLIPENDRAKGYGVAQGDINNDGYYDFINHNRGVAPFLYQNSGGENSFIKITLQGVYSNSMGIGAEIEVYCESNKYIHYVMNSENYLGQNSQHHIFGLANFEIVDSVEIEYLSGIVDKYYDLNVNQQYYFVEGETHKPLLAIEGSSTPCEGDTVEIYSGSYSFYEWSNGVQDSVLKVSESGSYWLIATDSLGNNFYSDTIAIEFYTPPTVEFVAKNPSCFNSEDGEIFLNFYPNIQAYELWWNDSLVGDTLKNVGAGIHTYTYTDEYGCIIEDTVTLTNPNAINVQTLIVEKEDTALYDLMILINGAQSPYEIYLNEVKVANEIEDLLAGIYSLKVVDANACEYEMNIEIKASTVSSIATNRALDFKIWPNPIEDSKKLTLQFNTRVSEGNIKCVNTLGEVMFDIHLNDLNKEMIEINFNNYMSKGVYYIIFSNKSIEKIKPIVVK